MMNPDGKNPNPWEILARKGRILLSRLSTLRPPQLMLVADGRVIMVRERPKGKPLEAWLPTFLKYARMRSPRPRKLELWALWPDRPPRRKLVAQAPAPRALSFAGEEAEKLEALMEAFGAKLVWRLPDPQGAQKE